MFATLLALLGLAAALALAGLALAARVAALARRVRVLEAQVAPRAIEPPHSVTKDSLNGLRVEISIRQDHPLAPFEAILAQALIDEGAVRVDGEGDARIVGTLKGNGYADVYFDADLVVESQGRALLKLREWPQHGDRPENLARELVARLREEWVKRERQGALRELGA